MGRTVISAMVLMAWCFASTAQAIHFYRGPDGGCTAATGELSDDPRDAQGKPIHGPVAAEIRLGHNYFHDGEAVATEAVAPASETTIKAGEAIRWTWNSAHCHSVEANDGSFESGYHYPATAPESPQVAPGVFDYPILDETPTLSYVHTFDEPGTYDYFCVHHASIGMTGRVIVEP